MFKDCIRNTVSQIVADAPDEMRLEIQTNFDGWTFRDSDDKKGVVYTFVVNYELGGWSNQSTFRLEFKVWGDVLTIGQVSSFASSAKDHVVSKFLEIGRPALKAIKVKAIDKKIEIEPIRLHDNFYKYVWVIAPFLFNKGLDVSFSTEKIFNESIKNLIVSSPDVYSEMIEVLKDFERAGVV